MFRGRFSKEGSGLVFSDYYRNKLKFYIKKNPNQPFELKPMLPESGKQRRFFEGAIVPLITFYQEGMDHRDSKHLDAVREWLKLEFNSDQVVVHGKIHRIARSTKNQLNEFLEKVIEWLIENYAPPMEALDPKNYKHWKDAIYPYGGADNYIDHLVSLRVIKNNANRNI